MEPVVKTQELSEITHSSALSGGIMVDDGGDGISGKGMVYALQPEPTVNDLQIASGQGLGDFTTEITDLKSGTPYFVRAYAANSMGISYGNELEFTTLATVAEVELAEIREITINSAKAQGEISHDGGAAVSEKGFCWATFPEPTVDDQIISLTDETDDQYSLSISGLDPDTRYFLRAYAKNALGISYSEIREFKTKDRLPEAPAMPGDH